MVSTKQILGFIPLLSIFNPASAVWTDFELRSIQDMNGTSAKPIFFNLRQKRMKKGVYGLGGTVLITDSFMEYETSIILYHSANGNGVFRQSPISLPRGPSCDKANGEYRKYVMNDLHQVSDLPYTNDENVEICPMFATDKTFTVNNYQFDSSILPKFIPPGLYKFHILMKKGDVLQSGVEVLFNLS